MLTENRNCTSKLSLLDECTDGIIKSAKVAVSIPCPAQFETMPTQRRMRVKSSNFGHKLVFGLLGGTYTVMGGVFLALALAKAGSLQQLFALSEDETVFPLLGTVFLVLGIVFLLVTGFLVRADKKRAQLREELLTWGQRVKGEVVDVRVDYSVKINRRCPVIAKVRCTLPSGEVTLKSPRLWDKCPATGDMVEVIYDPMDEKRYVIEFLQK